MHVRAKSEAPRLVGRAGARRAGPAPASSMQKQTGKTLITIVGGKIIFESNQYDRASNYVVKICNSISDSCKLHRCPLCIKLIEFKNYFLWLYSDFL